MKPFYLTCLAWLGFCLSALALTRGMTEQAVKAELGKPTSQMEMGDRTIWIYEDQKLEFESGRLIRKNGLELPTKASKPPAKTAPKSNSDSPLGIEMPVANKDLTITESARVDGLTPEDIGQNYNFTAIGEDLSEAIENYENARNTPQTDKARAHVRDVLLGFILEVVVTLIVLQIAFSLSGFPSILRQIALLSLAVALAGAMLDYFLYTGLLNPIRVGLSFLILLVLIRQMTDVREWATAIRIALLARLISLGLMWLALAGVMVLFGL